MTGYFYFSEGIMKNTKVTLAPLEADDREQFILDNQESFKYGAIEEFGLRDDHFEEDVEIISRATIELRFSKYGVQVAQTLVSGCRASTASQAP